MKVLIQHRHGTEISGVSTYVNFLLPELNALDIKSRIVSTREDTLIKWVKGIAWCDVVHMNSNHFGFIILCKILAKKVVVKYHFPFYKTTHSEYEKYSFSERIKRELKALLPKNSQPLKWKLFALLNYMRLGIRVGTAYIADYHIACSEFMAKSLDFPWPVGVLYNPIPLLHSNSKELGNLEDPLTFTFVGRLSGDKGVDILLEAAAKVKKMHSTFKVCIVGSGTSIASLKELAKKLDLEEQVTFKGRLAQAELLPIMKRSVALIVPSRIQDPAPYVVMEASSVKTCSIVSASGGLPEIATPSGFTFAREDIDALAQILIYALQHPEEMLNRGQQAYEYTAQNFSPSLTARQLVDLCKDLYPVKG